MRAVVEATLPEETLMQLTEELTPPAGAVIRPAVVAMPLPMLVDTPLEERRPTRQEEESIPTEELHTLPRYKYTFITLDLSRVH